MLKPQFVSEDHLREPPTGYVASVTQRRHDGRRSWLVLPAREGAFGRAMRSLWLAYQPIVRCSDHQVMAHEALVRSDEPLMADPLALFHAAERKGRRAPLGRRIRRIAAGDLVRVPGDVFLNLGPEDLLDPELYDGGGPLARFATRIVLEITEHAPLNGVPNLSGRLQRLRDLGFRLAVDDLGAGYSGHVNLAILEPEIVKIDAALVRGIDRDAGRRDVIRSLTKLCGKLHSFVVAEGVETIAERDILVSLGCDALQGFLLARPEREPPPISWS
jgi:EAL domain-containing protein (putative c-di-GMP-specific phosphodiesterase class I)